MYRHWFLRLALLCFLLTPSVCVIAGGEPTEVELAALAERRKVVSGDITYRVIWGVTTHRVMLKDRVVFDARKGWHQYVERWSPRPVKVAKPDGTVQQGQGEAAHLERYVMTPQEVLYFRPAKFADGKKFGISSEPVGGSAHQNSLIDPLEFGFLPTSVMMIKKWQLDTFVGSADREERKTYEADLQGLSCQVVEYRLPEGEVMRMWFSLDQAGNLVQIEEDSHGPKGHSILRVFSTLIHHEAAGVWFPQKVLYESIFNGERVGVEEIVVDAARLNIDVRAEQFTAAALEAPAGTAYYEAVPALEVSREWNGKSLAPVKSLTNSPVDVSETDAGPTTSRLRLVIGVNLVVLGLVISAYYLQQRYRRKGG